MVLPAEAITEEHDPECPCCNELKREKAALEDRVTELDAKVRWFEEQHRLALHRRFGASSEKADPNQFMLFNEDYMSQGGPRKQNLTCGFIGPVGTDRRSCCSNTNKRVLPSTQNSS